MKTEKEVNDMLVWLRQEKRRLDEKGYAATNNYQRKESQAMILEWVLE